MSEQEFRDPFGRWDPQQTKQDTPPEQGQQYAPQQDAQYIPQGGQQYASQQDAQYMPQQGQQYAPQQDAQYSPQGGQQQYTPPRQDYPYMPDSMNQPYMPQQPADGYGSAGYDPYLVHYTPQPKNTPAEPVRKKKSHIGMILGIVAGVLVVGTVITFWQLGFFHSRNGTYVWDDFSAFGLYSEIEINGDKAKITMDSNPASKTGDTAYTDTRTIEVDVYFDGNTVEFSKDGNVLVCEYDRKNGKIISRDDTYVQADIEFEKK